MALISKKPVAAKVSDLSPVAQSPVAQVEKTFEAATAQVADIQENVRKAAAKGLEQTREAYARVKTAAEEATHSVEASYTKATTGFAEINAKAIDALRANTDATFDFVKSLMGVKSVSEAITLQGEHARKQFEAITFQGKEISTLAQKIAADAVEPIRTSLGKTFSPAQ